MGDVVVINPLDDDDLIPVVEVPPAPVVAEQPRVENEPGEVVAPTRVPERNDGADHLLDSDTPEEKLWRAKLAAKDAGVSQDVIDCMVLPGGSPGPVSSAQRADHDLAEKTEQEKAREHALAMANGNRDVKPGLDMTPVTEDAETILLHFIEDGFTALGEMWYRGQELEFVIERNAEGRIIGSPAYLDTCNELGESWVDLCDKPGIQNAKYGKVLYCPGPWMGQNYADKVPCPKTDTSGEVCKVCNGAGEIPAGEVPITEERKRARRPPTLGAPSAMRTASRR